MIYLCPILLALFPLNFGTSQSQMVSQEMKIDSQLDRALNKVNASFSNKSYRVEIRKKVELNDRQPILLDLFYPKENRYEPIGAIHFIKLTPDCENLPTNQIARTMDELQASIHRSVAYHFKAKGDKEALISPSGTIIYKNGNNLSVKDGFFVIDDVIVKYENKPLEARRLIAEESLILNKLPSGDYGFENTVDQRKGKGIFISMPSGEIYRS